MLRSLIILKKNNVIHSSFLLSSCAITNDSTYVDPNYLTPSEFKTYLNYKNLKFIH